jgi:adiponectin receptor
MAFGSRVRLPSPTFLASNVKTEAHMELTSSSSPLPLPLPNMARVDKGRPSLLSYDEIPEWYRDNKYIQHGYRPVSFSARVSLASWLYLHNESVNIYSHLLPAIGFLFGEWYILHYLHSRYSNATTSDDLIFSFFLLAATGCLGLSTTYHTMINHSPNIEALWLRLDLVGIVLLTLGDFVSGIYMVFWCEPLQRKIYWSMVCTPPSVLTTRSAANTDLDPEFWCNHDIHPTEF